MEDDLFEANINRNIRTTLLVTIRTIVGDIVIAEGYT